MPLAYKRNQRYTYADYLSWKDDERWELIDGIAFNMTPAPSREHQEILVEFVFVIRAYLENRKCRVFPAPFDVRLPRGGKKGDDDIDTVVQPDISVVCDPSKLDTRGCVGAPDLVIEILSPYTADRDMRDKFFLYERSGVREYWIVDPGNLSVHAHRLDESGKYAPVKVYFREDAIESTALPGLSIDLKNILPEK